MSECYFCGSEVDIEEHHIVPQRFDGSDRESNTVDLCHDCHWKLERLYNKEFWGAIGVEDPRAARESHVKCEIQGCTNQAVTRVRVKGVLAYRCEEHEHLSGHGDGGTFEFGDWKDLSNIDTGEDGGGSTSDEDYSHIDDHW